MQTPQPIQLSISRAAVLYRNLGLSLIPLQPKSKEPAFNLLPGTWKIDVSPEDMAKWFGEDSKLNIGARLGVPSSNLFEIDFDDPDVFARFTFNGESFKDKTLTCSTGRGYKVLVFSDKPLDFTTIDFRPYLEMELRANNCYSVLPPSTHPNGKEYTVLGTWGIQVMSNAKKKILERAGEIGWRGKDPVSRTPLPKTALDGLKYEFNDPPCIRRILNDTPVGQRDNSALLLAAYYVNWRGQRAEDVVIKLMSWLKYLGDSYRDLEGWMRLKVKSALTGGYYPGCSALAEWCDKESCAKPLNDVIKLHTSAEARLIRSIRSNHTITDSPTQLRGKSSYGRSRP